MFKCKVLLFAVLAAAGVLPLTHAGVLPLTHAGVLPLTQACFAQSSAPAVSPAIAAKLRRLLPFPEEALRQTMEMSIGFGKWPGGGCRFRRYGSEYDNYAADSVATRRLLTGGLSDAPRWLILGDLCRRAGLPKKASAAYAQSAAICRKVLTRNPHNAPALADYGQTLAAQGQPGLAEAFLKHAAQIAPKSAEVQLALGGVLIMEAKPGTETGKNFAQEAARAYNRAVSLAPENPAVWTARAVFRTFTLPDLSGQPPSSAGLRDYEKAAMLSPNDLMAQIAVPDMELLVVETAHHLYTSPEALKAEPRSFNLRAKKTLRCLTKIAQSTQGQKSAEAYDARAWVQFEYFYDPFGTQNSLRLALLQNPGDEGARDYQRHVAAVNGDYALLAAFCRQDLKRRPSVRLRTILAYADYYMAQQKPQYWKEARTQMERAHDAAPQDDALRLGLAVLLLKSGQAAGRSRAAVLLSEIAPSAPGRSKMQQAEYDLTRGISAALAGHPAEARARLALALQADPHNQPASSALALLPATVTAP